MKIRGSDVVKVHLIRYLDTRNIPPLSTIIRFIEVFLQEPEKHMIYV